MADDRFVFGIRVSSISVIIDATDRFSRRAISCNTSVNSFSSDMLV